MSSRIRRSLAATLILLGAGALFWRFPAVDATAWQEGPPPQIWAYRQQQEATGLLPSHYHYVPLSQVSLDLQLAVLVAEDVGFLQHGALDPGAISEALQAWWAGHRLRGASTLSQQLAKNLFTSSVRSAWRKLAELRMAFWLERHLSKARIFELYLNIIELGPALYGVDAAAQAFYGTSAATVTVDQAASLAATIPAPRSTDPRRPNRAHAARRVAVVERMQRLGFLRQRLNQAAARP